MAIAIGYLLLSLGAVQKDDLTYDEQDHLNYGVSILKFNPSRLQKGRDFSSTMPITSFNALPRAAEQLGNPILQKKDFGESDARNGRYVTILATVLLLIYVYFFARAWGGNMAGYFAMLIVAMDPNILAHGHLVTTDIYSTLGFVASFYHLFQWLAKKRSLHFFYWSIAIAVAQCCKINNILLYPLSFVILAFYTVMNFRQLNLVQSLVRILVFVLFQILVINIFFLFNNVGMSLGEFTFKSQFFQNIQKSWIANIPMPFAKPYIETFDYVQYERETFDGTASNYLLGELRNKAGFSYYYYVVFLLKTPIFTLLTSLGILALMIVKRKMFLNFLLFWLLPIVTLFLFLNNSTVQSGYRYLLPVLCMTAIPAGQTISWLAEKLKKNWLPYILAVLIVAPALFAYPNYLIYTNEIVFNKTNAYQYFADSNLSWGQRHKQVTEFVKEHPDYIFEPGKPTKGIIIVELNNFVGIVNPNQYEWLRKDFKPFDNYDGCYLLFNVESIPVTAPSK